MKDITVNKRQQSKAFTVIEFAVVLVIIALTYATLSPAVMNLVDTAKSADTSEEIDDMQDLIDDYFDTNGFFPDSLEDVFDPVPLDPWGNPYQYTNHDNVQGQGKKRKDKNLVPINSDYDLYSMGPDGKTTSALTASISHDDVVRGRNGAYVGVALYY